MKRWWVKLIPLIMQSELLHCPSIPRTSNLSSTVCCRSIPSCFHSWGCQMTSFLCLSIHTHTHTHTHTPHHTNHRHTHTHTHTCTHAHICTHMYTHIHTHTHTHTHVHRHTYAHTCTH